MSGALILAIDTCTRFASVALTRDTEVQAELTWAAGLDHTRQLAPRVESLLAKTGIETPNLNAVAVAIGPGSFNGVRTGIGFAQAVCFALGIPLVGVSALEVQAYAHAGSSLPICVIQDAGRGELAAAVYRIWRHRWTQVRAEAIVSWDELETIVQRRMLVCGDLYPKLIVEVSRRLKGNALLASSASGPRRAGYLAELAWNKLEQGNVPPPETVQPIYLRRPAISQRRKP